MSTGENLPNVIYFHPKNAPKLTPTYTPRFTRFYQAPSFLLDVNRLYQTIPGLLSLNIDLPDNKVRQSLLG